MAQRHATILPLTLRGPEEGAFSAAGLTEVHTWRDLSGQVCARGYTGATGRWMQWPGIVAFHFDDSGRIDAYPEAGVDAAFVTDLCRRSVEPIVRQALGWETLHASAVRRGGAVVAFCGERETGKSTLAYSLARRGYHQQSDDAVVMQVAGEGVRVLDLPFGVRLRPEAAAFYGFEPRPRQVLHDVEPLAPLSAGPVATLPLRVIFSLARKPEGAVSIERLSSAAAFTALLAQAHCFDPQHAEGKRRLLQNYLAIADLVPVFRLTFSAGLDRLHLVLEVIEQAVQEVAAA